MTQIRIEPLTAEAFAPFGDVLAPKPAPDRMINAGRCERHHALATVERHGGEAIISIFRSDPVSLPYECALLERHPLGSQAFMPMGQGGLPSEQVQASHVGPSGGSLSHPGV